MQPLVPTPEEAALLKERAGWATRFGFPSGMGAALENGRLAQSVLRAAGSL
ncbi:hypothetical protein AB0L75_01825 [Streptomyces sp. NPDC052101]|uniref:hypothetical protein n=1 Tax=Streptomyces sp. NPDC052101 TaxID=3155763 RepID=UPI0034323143